MAEILAECPECGQKFRKKNWCHTFCSYECKYKHNFVSSAVHEERECKQCGKLFVTSNSRPLFCSRKCSKDYYNRAFCHSEWIRRGNTHGSELGYASKVQSKYSQFEYAGGWSNDNAYFICKDCGCVFRHNTKNFRPAETKKMSCPNCSDVLLRINRKEKELEKQAQRKEVKPRIKELSCDGIQISMMLCDSCGNVFIPKRKNSKYCSEKCRKSKMYRVKDAYRYFIPLDELAKRDGDICQICGKRVDWDDYYTNADGYTIYGNMYPSRDHIIPKAKGGSHTWQNMRLAHRICNTREWVNHSTKTS